MFADDGFQHISGLRDVRQVDLGLDPVGINTVGARGLCCTVGLAGSPEMCTDLLGFVVLKRTGMRLLLRDSGFNQHVENRFAFNFQLPGQVVDSNLTHPPLCSSGLSR